MHTNESPGGVTIFPETPFAPTMGGTSHLLIELEGRARPQTSQRRPLNLAIVLDRSGSMSGHKLDLARNAALHLIHRLQAQDGVTVVVYDDTVTVLASGTYVTPHVLPGLTMALASVVFGSSTNLEGGWHGGVQAVAEGMEQMPGALNHVLLLTNGLANVGITDAQALSSLATGVASMGIVTSTFGVGEDYDEQLLNAMAEAGGGNAYHIGTGADIHGHFQQELGELLGVIAEGVSVKISLPPGITAALVNPDVAVKETAKGMMVPVGFVSTGEKPQLVLRLTVAPAAEGTAHEIQVSVRWKSGSRDLLANLSWLVAGSAGERDPAVLAAVARQEAARARRDAYLRERAGDSIGAAATLRAASASIAAMPLMSMPAEAATLDDEAQEMARGSSDAQRKRMYNDVQRIKRSKQIDPHRP